MKSKLVSMILALSMLFTVTGYAIDVEMTDEIELVTTEDRVAIATAMSFYGIEGTAVCELLYDYTNSASYILGVTANGYMIMDRNSKVALEWGEGNPYAMYANEKKWYGAVLNYFVKDTGTNGFVDIRTNESVTQLPAIPLVLDQSSTLSFGNAGDIETMEYDYIVAGDPVRVADHMNSLRRIGFRMNVDYTCSAVATALVLNYLDRRVDDDIVPAHNEMESLVTSVAADGGYYYNASYFPKAIALCEYLINTCAMGNHTLPFNVTSAVSNYSDYREYDISLTTSIDRYDVMDSIDNDIPCMITTGAGVLEHDDWNNHTMVIYGYRTYSNSQVIGWQVHTGHYTDVVGASSTTPYMGEIWINPALGSSVLYQFNSPNW